jgi:hypothetical protein
MEFLNFYSQATPSKYEGINLFKNIWGKISDGDVYIK